MTQPILSILIPTYNRASYLDINLSQLHKNIEKIIDKDGIEIIVSDNASTDNTCEIIEKYMKKGLNINFIQNKENIGADGNFISCVKKATGKYCWIFGDDELLMDNALPKLYGILKNNEVGLVYVKGINYDKTFDLTLYKNELQEKLKEYSKSEYIEKISYFITFITGNIFNKTYLPQDFDFEKFKGTSLIQVNWFLNSLKESQKNLILEGVYFFIKENNTGGFNVVKVFATNFNEILKSNLLSKKLIIKINNDMLRRFFLHFIKNDDRYIKKGIKRGLLKNYYQFPVFWRKYSFFLIKDSIKDIIKIIYHKLFIL